MGVVVETLALEALALHGLGRRDQAHAALARALSLAEPEGYVRVFADEGEPMRLLIEKQARNLYDASSDRLLAYAGKLLAAFPSCTSFSQPTTEIRNPLKREIPKSEMAEPLSKRELEVLHLIADGLSNEEIAERLVVGKSTIKTHINRIFSKLGATSRKQAVVRAQELNLL